MGEMDTGRAEGSGAEAEHSGWEGRGRGAWGEECGRRRLETDGRAGATGSGPEGLAGRIPGRRWRM